ncbi:glycosyl transferase group 1 [Sulfuricurvum kujiense DSM 16994]|uniref:Glycosyl transferase group 1 n=1 Tax=Sulfuricurvum kujiense (strain ATCC BAA-921 / DSM 16994 / JCM 11577 / YK-1) TaxID=709032 RepID=E4U379_SULKY|nr:glycosyltransferase family 1 protein [Sulfuricurvum kujiense]ADR34776.1 glycosyl transferase group 1 [Sulfuricurvum kujiense DSM 16994]
MPICIYLDCTHTYNSGLGTGIQRVVKNIVRHIPIVSKETNCEIVPVILHAGNYYKFDDFPIGNKKNNELKLIFKKIYTTTRAFLDFILPKKLGQYLYAPTLGIVLNKFTDKLLFSKKIDPTKKVTINSNDILLLIDSTWLYNNYKLFEKLKQKNVKIVALIYDIIPIAHPEFFTIDLIAAQKEWYKKAIPYIDGYIAISNTVKEELYAYIKSTIDPYMPKEKFDYFYLGADFATEYDETKVSQSFKNNFYNPNTYITVSTIEPRKNHSYILDTFDTLWQKGEDAVYIMIGRKGWKTETLIAKIQSHVNYNKKLFLIEDADDNALIYAYKHAKALIFASHIEGFGLPIIESMFYKLPVLASDTPIHREIGRDKIEYFDLSDSEALVKVIQAKKLRSVEEFTWQDWHKSTKDLILKSREI